MDDEQLSPIERAIRDAMARGEFDSLAGTGEPLHLDDDRATPNDLRLAYKLLRDNDLAPEWMMQGRWLEERHDQLLRQFARGLKAYRGALADAERRDDAVRREQVEAAWLATRRTFQTLVERYNREVLNYNIKVPPAVGQRHFLSLDVVLAKL